MRGGEEGKGIEDMRGDARRRGREEGGEGRRGGRSKDREEQGREREEREG